MAEEMVEIDLGHIGSHVRRRLPHAIAVAVLAGIVALVYTWLFPKYTSEAMVQPIELDLGFAVPQFDERVARSLAMSSDVIRAAATQPAVGAKISRETEIMKGAILLRAVSDNPKDAKDGVDAWAKQLLIADKTSMRNNLQVMTEQLKRQLAALTQQIEGSKEAEGTDSSKGIETEYGEFVAKSKVEAKRRMLTALGEGYETLVDGINQKRRQLRDLEAAEEEYRQLCLAEQDADGNWVGLLPLGKTTTETPATTQPAGNTPRNESLGVAGALLEQREALRDFRLSHGAEEIDVQMRIWERMVSDLESQHTSLLASVKGSQARLDVLNDTLANTPKDVVDPSGRSSPSYAYQIIESRKAEIASSLAGDKQKIEEVTGKLKDAQQKVKELGNRKTNAQAGIDNFTINIERLVAQYELASKQFLDVYEQYWGAYRSTQVLESQLKRGEKLAEQYKQQIADLRKELVGLERKEKAFQAQMTAFGKVHDALVERLSNVESLVNQPPNRLQLTFATGLPSGPRVSALRQGIVVGAIVLAVVVIILIVEGALLLKSATNVSEQQQAKA